MPKKKWNKKRTHSVEQIEVINWCRKNESKHPDLWFIFAIQNGGGRSKREASILKLEGTKPGVSDLFLSVPSGNFHGLYIEIKREDCFDHPRENQIEWLKKVSEKGYAAVVAHGSKMAIKYIKKYLDIKE